MPPYHPSVRCQSLGGKGAANFWLPAEGGRPKVAAATEGDDSSRFETQKQFEGKQYLVRVTRSEVAFDKKGGKNG